MKTAIGMIDAAIEALEKGSTSAPVVEILKAARGSLTLHDGDAIRRAADNFHDLLAIVQTKLAKIVEPDEHPHGKQLFVEFLDRCIASRNDLRRLAPPVIADQPEPKA